MKPLFVITGPTASGKSSLSVKLAHSLNAEIVCMDSVQIYRGLDIGSAKISDAEKDGIPHYLLDIRNANQQFNAGEFLELAEEAIRSIRSRGKNVIVSGGTTMYLTALLYGLADLPKSNLAARSRLESYSTKDLYQRLGQLDREESDRLHPNDRLRVIRSLEAIESSGRPVSELKKEHALRTILHPAVITTLWIDRKDLYGRINGRCQEMVKSGLVDETERMLSIYPAETASLKSVGYLQAVQCLSGQLEASELSEAIAQQTRRYAKRQMTYFRNEPKKRNWKRLPADSSEISVEGETAYQLDFGCLTQALLSAPEEGVSYLPVNYKK